MKKLLALALALIMILSLTACGAAPAPEAAAPEAAPEAAAPADDFQLTLKYAYANSATDPSSIAFSEMCDRITERTNGALKLEFYPNNELGGIADVMEQLQMGGNIITTCSADFLADYCPDHAALNGTYLYDTWEDMQIVAKSDWYKGLMDQLDEHNVHVLFFGGNGGHRHMISTYPIYTPEDLVGKNARVSGGLMFVEMYKALQASPITLPWAEVYQGLQQGIVEVAEAPLYTIDAAALQEVANYVTLTSHIICADTVVMNTELFESIPAEYQEILLEEISTTVMTRNAVVDGDEAAAMEKMKAEGVTFIELTDEERAAFAEATKSMYTNIDTLSPGIYDTIRAIIDAG